MGSKYTNNISTKYKILGSKPTKITTDPVQGNEIVRLTDKIKGLLEEISNSNKALNQSNSKLKKEIDARKKLELKNEALHDELVVSARRAGMADIATSILHNIGNLLNSINTSVTMIREKIRDTKVSNLSDIASIIQEHQNDIGKFITEDDRGKRIPNYLIMLSEIWGQDRSGLLNEFKSLEKHLDHVKEIVAKQKALSTALGVTEKVNVTTLIEDALILTKIPCERASIEITRDFSPIKPIVVDRVKLLQVFVNLIKNAVEAILENKEEKSIYISVKEKNGDFLQIGVKDTGIGILPENLNKIFSYGFTTKADGHGFGLYTSILAIQEIGGTMAVSSEGLGKGAIFTIVLPYHLKGEGNDA